MRFFREFFHVALIALPSRAMAQWDMGGALATSHNDNINRASDESQAQSVHANDLSLWATTRLPLADFTALEWGGTLSRQQTTTVSGLSNTRLGLMATLTHKLGLGDKAVISVGTQADRVQFNDERRNAWLYRVSAAIRKRQSEGWLWTLSLNQEVQDGDLDEPRAALAPLIRPGNVFDWHAWQVTVDNEWDTGESSWLRATAYYRDGDITASVPRNPSVLSLATAASNDPLFGNNHVAYRIDGNTRALQVEWNHSLGEATSFNIGAERQWTHAADALRYRVTIIRAGLFHEF